MAIEAEFAPAKINLALHVTGQRADHFHLLDSIVVFAGVGDSIRIAPSDHLSLAITGPRSADLPLSDDNLVLRAARLLATDRGAAITLHKVLPVASGIGGGSADAAATLRSLARAWSLQLPDTNALLALGADVPVCVLGRAARIRGIGERITPLPPLPDAYLVLINPGIALPTPQAFLALINKVNAPLPDMPRFQDAGSLAAWLALQRNDLEPHALVVAPVIAAVTAALKAQPGCLLARMSGSGATCFGLFATRSEAESATAALQTTPGWWVATAPILN